MRFSQTLVCALALTANVAAAQAVPKVDAHPRKPNPPKASSAPSSAHFAPVFYQPEASATDYAANDPEKVAAWVLATIDLVPGRIDKFSSRDEREQRAQLIKTQLDGVGLLPFLTKCEVKYDADAQTYLISTMTVPFRDAALKDPNPEKLQLRQLILKEERVASDTYLAQNAYGARTEVRRTVSRVVSLAIRGSGGEPSGLASEKYSNATFPYDSRPFTYGTKLKMSPAEAREVDSEIACLVIMRLEHPYVFTFTDRYLPSRDLPYDATSNGVAMFGRLEHFMVVNRKTGVNYVKVSLEK